MSLFVLVTVVQAVAVTVAHKASVYASARVALEKARRTRVIARLALIGRLVLATCTIAITVAEPIERNALVVTTSELIVGAWHRVAKQPVLVGSIATIVVTVAQPASHDAHVRVGTLDVEHRARAV